MVIFYTFWWHISRKVWISEKPQAMWNMWLLSTHFKSYVVDKGLFCCVFCTVCRLRFFRYTQTYLWCNICIYLYIYKSMVIRSDPFFLSLCNAHHIHIQFTQYIKPKQNNTCIWTFFNLIRCLFLSSHNLIKFNEFRPKKTVSTMMTMLNKRQLTVGECLSFLLFYFCVFTHSPFK